MRYIVFLALLFIGGMGVFSCTKYKDTKTTGNPHLTNPYCNDPNAVNYNWNFPGTPDNSICFYPTDIFKGVYEFHDSVFFTTTGFFISYDTFIITIAKNSTTKFTIAGFCTSGASLGLTAGVNYVATVDTMIGDSTTTVRGQPLCSVADTINGTLTKDRLNDSLMYINFVVASDTGVTTTHIGSARLLHK